MRNGFLLLAIAICANFLQGLPLATAGTKLEQVVTTQIDKSQTKANYTWKVDGEKFNLRVTSSHGEVTYLFNGRILYVCSKIGDELIQQLRAMKVEDRQFLDDLKKGSCQAVPANFMARFFLSPAGAISTIDYSDGMELTLEMKNYSFKSGVQGQAANESCTRATRNFEVLRKDSQNVGVYQKVDEEICFAEKYDWRTPFWKQISRNLLRQPSAKGLLKSLQEDNEKLRGFVLSSRGAFEKADAKGIMRKGTRSVETIGVKNMTFANVDFSPPSGFAIVDVHSKILTSKSVRAGDLQSYEVEKDPLPVILFHILGGIL